MLISDWSSDVCSSDLRVSARSDALAAIGLISFAGAAQFLPALIGGIYWRGGTERGAVAGLATGFAVWAYTLVVPSIVRAGFITPDLLSAGPFAIAALRPEALDRKSTRLNSRH